MRDWEVRPMFSLIKEEDFKDSFSQISTPAYVVEEEALRRNGEILKSIIEETGCKILLAQKAFSNYDFYPLLSQYISGTEASGLYEARLGAEEMPGKEVHVFCGAYSEGEFTELLKYADHIVFNSPAQLKKFGKAAKEAKKSIGLRINPECSTQEGHDIYDPCAPGSRLGTTRQVWEEEMTKEWIEELDGLHFHTLCEQDADALEITWKAVEEKFADVLPKMKWINLGGGHHITRPDYHKELLKKILMEIKEKWKLQIYLEPGEAVALNAGYLVCRVLDIVKNKEEEIAILDTSAACHMPDVIEMPYTPPLYGAAGVGEKEYTYRLGGPTCLSGDQIGIYSFSHKLQEKDILLFGDMAIYTTCKNNTFNGMPLPAVWKRDMEKRMVKLKEFGYEDFKMRLGSKSR
ncbi:MAG: carboxynorspermidine decarboxylase [Lachnospiraceae bacterium]|nr:carboxynorspermidine decarboxylase [Lachnospiraceae bacterium]